MKRLKLFSASLIVLAIYLITLVYLAMALPADASIPFHWNAKGVIDGWVGKSTALIFGLGMNLGLFFLLYLIPHYSPKYRQQAVRFDKILPAITFVLILFMCLLSLYGLFYPLGADRLPLQPVLIIIGLLLLLLGNLLPKVPRNFFIGIRTPWSISDEDNWYKTHRVGAWCFVIGGLLLTLKGILPLSERIQVTSTWALMALLLFPVLYSFLFFLKSKK